MSDNAETAILAGGCFWGMQEVLPKREGVIATRAGYTGGKNSKPTDQNHPGHAEAVEIIFDPARISYRGNPRVLLPDPRPDDQEPSGQVHRLALPLGDLLYER